MSRKKDFERRLRAIEARLNAERPPDRPPLTIVTIEGGLPREIFHAVAGGHTWTRDLPHETLEVFVERCAIEAHDLGEHLLTIGGLGGPMPEKLEDFLATLHFDDVPPVTSPGHSGWRADR